MSIIFNLLNLSTTLATYVMLASKQAEGQWKQLNKKISKSKVKRAELYL